MENGISGEITDMDTLLRHPATVGAARLTGNTNFLPAAACSGGVKLDGWNIVLSLKAEAETATVVIPEGMIALGEGTHTALVDRVIRDLNGSVVLLRPADGGNAPFLRVRVLENTAPARERPQRSTSSRTNACATSESAIVRGTAGLPAVPLVSLSKKYF